MVRDETGKAMNVKEIYEACQQQISARKERVDQLEQTNLVYQQTMYQLHGQIMYLQEHLEETQRRMVAAEAANLGPQ